MVVHAIKQFRIQIAIIQIYGRSRAENARHGVPDSARAAIWFEWGKEILRRYGCHVVPDTGRTLGYVPGSVRYVFDVRVAESAEKAREQRAEPMRLCKNFLRHVPRDIISKQFSVRDKSTGLSATKFTRCLMSLRVTRRGVVNAQKCAKFVPTDISDEAKLNYVRYLVLTYGRWFR